MKSILVLALVALACADRWALIAAGSDGYDNYRHQAGASHAYDLLTKKGGFPKDRVILMMFDDIARNSRNPFKDNIIHQPNGPNVYPGKENIDYVGNDVTAKNWMSILKGDKAAMKGIGSGRVIESTGEDELFVYLVDHGGPGIFAFPTGAYLYAKDLIPLLQDLHTQHKYKRMLFYICACESGSMFDKLLPTDIQIKAYTASNPSESGYACYYDDKRGAYLASEYSAYWTQFSDWADFDVVTVNDEYANVTGRVKQSHPSSYGQESMAKDKLAIYQSYTKKVGRAKPVGEFSPIVDPEAVPERDVELHLALKQDGSKFGDLMGQRRHWSGLFEKLSTLAAGGNGEITKWTCYKNSIEAVERECGRTPAPMYGSFRVLANLCSAGVSPARVALEARMYCA